MSPPTIAMLAGLIGRRRRAIGSRWRKASPAEQAVLVLAMLRHDQRLLDLSRANAVSAATLRRWLLEAVDLLAARAPRLDRVLRRLAARGAVVVLADGTLIRTRRRTGVQNRRNYSGKHKPTASTSKASPTRTDGCCGSRRHCRARPPTSPPPAATGCATASTPAA
ncbi:hypothetical protein [Amycolatopsis sp. A1MSW2902]|uniref:hypothetical protein n=1 Tax=Amycolatopsis sp. A1MSW2902 TaxID=687413 RepID=UPI00307DFE9E